LFCLCRASERSRHSDSKVDEVLILDNRTQYFIMFRRTFRKRGYLPSSPITALFVAFFLTLIEYLHSLKCAFFCNKVPGTEIRYWLIVCNDSFLIFLYWMSSLIVFRPYCELNLFVFVVLMQLYITLLSHFRLLKIVTYIISTCAMNYVQSDVN
jgi:hypothetical protein